MLRIISFCSLVVALSLMNAVYAVETAGRVKLVEGEVNIVRGNTSTIASVGMELLAEDKIVTGPKSAVGVVMHDGTRLSFGPRSISLLTDFHFDPVNRNGNMFISLLKGTMRFVTGTLGKAHPDSVSIRTYAATIGIRGTDFVISAKDGE